MVELFQKLADSKGGALVAARDEKDTAFFSAKVLVELFQKLARVEAAEASSPPAGGETLQTAFLFCELFSLRLWCQRKKWLRNSHSSKKEGETPLVVSPIILIYPKSDGRKREIRETPFPPCKRIRCDVTR